MIPDESPVDFERDRNRDVALILDALRVLLLDATHAPAALLAAIDKRIAELSR
jgi:hypothetical protein